MRPLLHLFLQEARNWGKSGEGPRKGGKRGTREFAAGLEILNLVEGPTDLEIISVNLVNNVCFKASGPASPFLNNI
jgi:hypothetical protein